MTTGFNHLRGKTAMAVLWMLLAVLVGGGIVGWLLLFADPRTTVEPVVLSPSDRASSSQGTSDSRPGLEMVGEDRVGDPTSLGRHPRESALEVDAVKTFLVQGHVRDAETLKPVPLYEMYFALGVGGDPLRLPETHRPHHVRNLEGWFQVGLTSAGKHQLLIRSKTHEDLVRPVTVPLEDPLDLVLARGAWITGTVRDDRGKPQPGVTLWLQPQSRSPDGTARDVRRTISDEEGLFAFYKLTPGAYRLVAGTLTAPLDVREDLRVEADQRVEEFLVLPRLTTLFIQVHGADGQPLPDARVTLLTESGDLVRTAVTDSAGASRLPSVQQGMHRLQIRATGLVALEEEIYVSTAQPGMQLSRTLSR